MATVSDSPLIKQYFEVKEKYPQTLLLFRVGDFYEMFGQDALIAVDILNIALTHKSNGAAGKIEMAGFPHHALDSFLPKLVRAGKRVAICDQLEDPSKTKKLVKRGVTELVTPGVSTNEAVLSIGENNFLAALHIDKNRAGVAFLDISTGEFLTAEGNFEYVDKLLSSFMPKEIIYERSKRAVFAENFHHQAARFEMEDWVYTSDAANERLLKFFQISHLKGFGIQHLPLAIIASASIFYYMDMTEHRQLSHIQNISRIEEDKFVRLDRYTIRSLELCNSINEGGKSLLDVLDKTSTAMGKRLMRRWILFPLKEVSAINKRLDVVEYFFKDLEMKDFLKEQLSQIGDLERMVSKISVGRISPRDVVYMKQSLKAIKEIKNYVDNHFQGDNNHPLYQMIALLDACEEICQRIERELVDNPPIAVNRGEVIRCGMHAELDELRQLSSSGKDYLLKIQERETLATGIASLKIAYNNVFGYYIEVRNTYKDKVPENWIRKQTLVSAERYITPELKEYEEKIMGAEDRISQIESELFNQLLNDLVSYHLVLQKNAQSIAQIDCLLSFAEVSKQYKYFRPVVDEADDIDIVEGRHPVIEQQLNSQSDYISNDVRLSNKDQQILMITGPNMAGKSALIRQ
ncbi:MAG: DNA mismatch repair protein MutS, partial [Bacteroidales bacterium]|nr:DNA mismatch repair protein MutS [Bacteroidales bacterium]